MTEERNSSSKALIRSEAHSLTQYSGVVSRGLKLALALSVAKPIRVLIVDDIRETRENIRKLLSFEQDIQIVGEAQNGIEAIKQFDDILPDVLTIDTHMPFGYNPDAMSIDMQMLAYDGIAATAEIYRKNPNAKIIFATVHDPTRAMWDAGAKAYLVEPFSGEEISSAIREVAEGVIHASTLVYDSESLKNYYAHSGILIDGFIDTLEKLNARIVSGLSRHSVRAFLRDVHHFEVGLPGEFDNYLQIKLTRFLRLDLEAQIENIWRMEIEPKLNELEEYFHEQGRYNDFRWDKVKNIILR